MRDSTNSTQIGLTANRFYRSYEGFVWHKEESKQSSASKEFWAAHEGKFYADYVMLLLYATAEDFAVFILHFLRVLLHK